MGNASRFYREIVSKSSLKWFPHSQYMISLLLIRGIPIESLYQQFPAIFTMEIRVWRFQNYRDCGYTCNPHKFEIPALWFPRRDPVNPCKHLQCMYCDAALVFVYMKLPWKPEENMLLCNFPEVIWIAKLKLLISKTLKSQKNNCQKINQLFLISLMS